MAKKSLGQELFEASEQAFDSNYVWKNVGYLLKARYEAAALKLWKKWREKDSKITPAKMKAALKAVLQKEAK